ncbi:hypothetical protein Dimus_021489 [Dionaea muscipula]
MRKKLDTRFPAAWVVVYSAASNRLQCAYFWASGRQLQIARIKKIMQADEDVGKIAMAVPLLVSKALELFLQDLCDRTYKITLQKGARTMSSVHLKLCVQSFNVFDFLREIVSRVPDLGATLGEGEDRTAAKRRKVIDNEHDIADEESKKSKMVKHLQPTSNGAAQTGFSGRGRGRGIGRGRGRGNRIDEDEIAVKHEKTEDCPGLHSSQPAKLENGSLMLAWEESKLVSRNAEAAVRNFDLNIGWEESEDLLSMSAAAQANTLVESAPDASTMVQELPGWALSDMESSMPFDSIQLASLNHRPSEEEEDYDDEG